MKLWDFFLKVNHKKKSQALVGLAVEEGTYRGIVKGDTSDYSMIIFSKLQCTQTTRPWHLDALKRIMYVPIILHNLIAEDERATYGGNLDCSYDHLDNGQATLSYDSNIDFQEFLCKRFDVRDKKIHDNYNKTW